MNNKEFTVLCFILFGLGVSLLVTSFNVDYPLIPALVGTGLLLVFFVFMYGGKEENNRARINKGLFDIFGIPEIDNPDTTDNISFARPDYVLKNLIKERKCKLINNDLIIMDFPNYPAFRVVQTYPHGKYVECMCLDNRCNNISIYHYECGKFYRINLDTITSRLVYIKQR